MIPKTMEEQKQTSPPFRLAENVLSVVDKVEADSSQHVSV